ncbi:MAG: helix-turn-helix transcriptional regulator [Lachnospiraceae bacterium]
MYKIDYHLHLNTNEKWNMKHPHFHESIEILLSLSDGGKFLINHKLYQIQKGSLFILKGTEIHKSIVEKDYKRYVFHISYDSLKMLSTTQTNFTEYLSQAASCTLLPETKTAALIDKFNLLGLPTDDEFGCDLRKFSQFVEFLIMVCAFAETDEHNIMVENINFNKIEPILKFIHDNLCEPLTLDQLSSQFFINKYHLCRTFKSATGFSVLEYIINCRILKARELLRKGYRVQETGEMVGFRNNSHFIRTFGELTDISPKRYANEFGQGQYVSMMFPD